MLVANEPPISSSKALSQTLSVPFIHFTNSVGRRSAKEPVIRLHQFNSKFSILNSQFSINLCSVGLFTNSVGRRSPAEPPPTRLPVTTRRAWPADLLKEPSRIDSQQRV